MLKNIIAIIIILMSFNTYSNNSIITKENIEQQGIVTNIFYSVNTLEELNKMAKKCMVIAADNEDYQRICSSAYIDRKYSL